MPRILIVEDEAKIASVLNDYLKAAGFDTHIIDNGNDVAPWAASHSPDLVLLDLMLPGKDGLAVCREIREFSNVPIIMVTARADEVDRLLGLELGADDYVCKPFSPREIVARVKAVFRRLNTLADPRETTSGIAVDDEQHDARLDDQGLGLTRVEFRLLKTLANPPGRVWSRDQLLDRMYDDGRVVSDRTVDSHITNLRRKLQQVRPACEGVRAVYGVGYRLDLDESESEE